MKKLLLISMFAGMLPLSMVAQVDDLYFVPKKKSAEKVTDNYGMPTDVYYSGSDRSIDEYNRRGRSTVEVLDNDTTANDIIVFSPEKGVYPSDSLASDSVSDEDFKLTKRMSRFEDYRLTDNEAFWAGYNAVRYDWAWHSPWYYTRYGWYDPWYYGRWGWYDPWYYSRWGYYGWYDPWYYGYYSSWYDPWYYRGWGYYGGVVWYGGSVSRPYANRIGAGTIRRDGGTYAGYRRSGSSSNYANSSRVSTLRNRTVNGNSRNGRVDRSSRTYNNSNYGNRTYNSGSFNGSRSSGSFSGGSRSGGSFGGGGGGFSGGSRGGGGGGGSRMGGRR